MAQVGQSLIPPVVPVTETPWVKAALEAQRKRKKPVVPVVPEPPIVEEPVIAPPRREGEYLTAEETKERFDIDLEPGWQLRIKTHPQLGVSYSQVSPEGWEVDERGGVRSPEGRYWTAWEYEQELLGPEFPTVAEYEREEVERATGIIFAEEELDTILQAIVITPDMGPPERDRAEQAQQEFIETLQAEGRNWKTEAILRQLGASEEQIVEFFPEPTWDEAKYYAERYAGMSLPERAVNQFIAGIGQVLITSGGVARRFGYDEAGETLSSLGSDMQRMVPPREAKDFELSSLLNPEWYLESVIPTIPFALSLLPLAVGGYFAGAGVATAAGLGTIWTAIVGGITGAALSRPAESALEAGAQYDDAIARGKTEKEAQEEFDRVFRDNMVLAGADAFEIAVALAPTPKWVPLRLVKSGLVRTARIGGKMVIVGLSEGGEEIYQDLIQRRARGEEWQWDPISKEVFAIGAIMGMGMGLGGDMVASIVNRSKAKMSPAIQKDFNNLVSDFEAEGFTTEQSELRALDGIAETPEGRNIVTRAIEEVKKEIPEKPPTIPSVTPIPEVAPTPITERVVVPPTVPTPEAVPEVIPEAELPEGVRGLAPQEAIETRKEMGTLADYTDDRTFRDFLGQGTKYWSELTYNKAKTGKSFKVYRAVPTNITEIHLGAWVTQSREYAQEHLGRVLRGEGHVIEGTAKANELVAMSENEFFYVPEVPPEVAVPRVTMSPRLNRKLLEVAKREMLNTEARADLRRFYREGDVEALIAVGEKTPRLKDFTDMAIEELRVAVPEAVPEITEREEVLTRLREAQLEVSGLKEWLASEPASKLIGLIKKTGWYKGEVSNLTLRQYRDLTGKTDISPTILTADKKHVRWEYALDDIATEMGYESGEALKTEIERVGGTQARIKALQAEIAGTEVPIEEAPPTPVEEIAKLPAEDRAEAELKANREKMYEAVTKPREEGEIPRGIVRHPSHYRGMEDFTAEVNKELFTPIKESPLDTAAVAYLKTGDFADYLAAMPVVSELKLQALGEDIKANINELIELRGFQNSEIAKLEAQGLPERGLITAYRKAIANLKRDATFTEKLIKQIEKLPTQPLTIEDATSLGIALRRTRGGNLVPAIRRSGFYVTTEFAESPHLQDVPYVSGFWQDIDALFEHIDGGRAAGTPADPTVAQKYIQRPTNRNFLAYKKFLDAYFLRAQEGFERFGLTGHISKAKWDSIFQTVQEITAAEAGFKTAQVLRKPAIQELLSKYDKQTQSDIVEFAQWARAFLDEMVGIQNQARAKRGQESIGYIERYLSWVAERNIWSTLGFAKRTPSQMHAKPPAPDFIHPDAPFNPRAMAREGGMRAYPMETNVHKLLFDYVRTAGKDIFFTNTVQSNKIHIAALRSMGLDSTATLLEEYNAEVWAGAKPRITKAYEAFLPKPIPKATYMLRRQLTRNVFPLNWIWSLTIQPSSIAFTAGRTGPVNLVKGLDFLFMPSANRFARDTYTYIIKSQRSGKMAFQDIGTQVEANLQWEGSFIDKAESYAGFMVNVVEKLLTGISIRAGYHYGKSLGFTGEELVEYASKMGAKTQSMYNVQNVPAVLRAKPVGALLPFQTFTIQAMNYTREMVGVSVWKAGAYETISAKSAEGKATISRRLGLTASFLIAMLVINMVIDKLTNRKPWILSSFIPMVALLQMGLESSNPWNLLLPHKYISEFQTGFKQAIQYEDFTKLRKWFVTYHFPFGGSQINRMLDGIEAVIKGKVEDVRGTELFEVRQDEWLKAIFMGPYQTEGGREYIDRLQEKQGKWYEFTGIPITLKRVDINDEIDKSLLLLGKTDEDGMQYDFGDFVSDLREIRRAVGDKRFNISVSPFIDGFKKAEASREIIEKLPPKKLKNMDEDDIADFIFPEADPENVEVTALWTDFNTLKTKEQRRAFIADYIKQHADELKDNMVAKYYGLLEDMELLTGKDLAAFLEGHPELTRDWRSEWRRDNPEDDARLSMWGYGGKIQTEEAFDLIRKWSEELGIDLDHLPTWLPPKGSEENYFEFMKEMTERSWNSWEAQLILAKDKALREALGYDPIETPVASLELKVKHRDLFDKYETLETDEERAKLKVDNPGWVDDMRRIEAIEHGASEDVVEQWVERGQVVDEFNAGSSEAKVWLVDHKDAWDWALENDILTDDGSDWNVPVLRINAEWRKDDEAYNALETTEDRVAYLDAHVAYRKARRRREAYGDDFPEAQIENFAEYWELPVSGYRQERFLVENPEFANAMRDIKGIDIPTRVPSVEYDILLEKEDRTPEDERRMEAYKLYLPEGQIDTYVDWYETKRTGYYDDWFLMENMAFYNEMVGRGIWQPRDFSKVPSRHVALLLAIYRGLPTGQVRYDYRAQNPDLEYWFVNVEGYTPIGERGYEGADISRQEQIARQIAEGLRRLEELK